MIMSFNSADSLEAAGSFGPISKRISGFVSYVDIPKKALIHEPRRLQQIGVANALAVLEPFGKFFTKL